MPDPQAERGWATGGFFLMEPAARFLEFAEECERLAALTRDERHRVILKEMAETWRKLAKNGESPWRR